MSLPTKLQSIPPIFVLLAVLIGVALLLTGIDVLQVVGGVLVGGALLVPIVSMRRPGDPALKDADSTMMGPTTPITALHLSPQALSALKGRQIETVAQVLTIDPDLLLTLHAFGPEQLMELHDRLVEFGFLPALPIEETDAGKTAMAPGEVLRKWLTLPTRRAQDNTHAQSPA